jgi:hypothetical protein
MTAHPSDPQHPAHGHPHSHPHPGQPDLEDAPFAYHS